LKCVRYKFEREENTIV